MPLHRFRPPSLRNKPTTQPYYPSGSLVALAVWVVFDESTFSESLSTWASKSDKKLDEVKIAYYSNTCRFSESFGLYWMAEGPRGDGITGTTWIHQVQPGPRKSATLTLACTARWSAAPGQGGVGMAHLDHRGSFSQKP